MFREKINGALDVLLWGRSRIANFITDVVRPGSDCTDELRAARLNAAY